MNMMMSKMYFHFGFGEEFFFKGFIIDNTFKMWLVCGILFALTILYEAIKYVRCVRCGCQVNKNMNGAGDMQDGPETTVRMVHNCYVGRLRGRRHRLIQTLMHVTQTTIGFILMLAVMSFNLCIIFAVVAGKPKRSHPMQSRHRNLEC